jgi:DNA polymerase III subunit delta
VTFHVTVDLDPTEMVVGCSVTPEQAIERAKRGELLPVYLVVGEEDLLRDEVVAALRAASLGGAVAAFNEDKFTAGEVDCEKVIAAARTVPMMAKRRFVLVRGVERWDSSSRAEGGEAGDDRGGGSPLDRLADYAADPVDSTCLVLSAQKIDGRRKLAAVARKNDFAVACEPLAPREMPAWIRARFAAKGQAIEAEVAELLAEIAGTSLAYVSDAVERLSLYAGEGNPVTEDAVSECIARVRTADTWALVDAVGARDLARALGLLADTYDPRDRGLPLLGAVAWSIRQIARYGAAVDAGASSDEAARRAGVFQPYRARELAKKARTLRGKEIERWLLVLAETDVALKSSRRPPQAILEEMIVSLCRAGKKRDAAGARA